MFVFLSSCQSPVSGLCGASRMMLLSLVMIALSFLKMASRPSSHSCPTDTNKVCRLGKWCDSLAEADTFGRQRDEVHWLMTWFHY